ncbi:hypothetical protein ACS0TY_012985 [Phlomoides rotata]
MDDFELLWDGFDKANNYGTKSIKMISYAASVLQLQESVGQAFRFSTVAYGLSGVLALFLPIEYRTQSSMGQFFVEQIIFYIGSFVVFLCWELSHHLHQILHTKRFVFAPPKGSAAAETIRVSHL